MSQTTKVLRNSLIALALTAVLPAWAGPQALSSGARPAPQPVVQHTLDLKAPDIRDVMPPDERNSALPNPDDAIVVEPETVQVHGATAAPFVPGGFAALYWAAKHPIDAWRILAPVQ